MIGIALLTVLAVVVLFVWIGGYVLRGPLRPDSRLRGAAFTALMTLGIAACVAGLPYVGESARLPLVLILSVSLLTSWVDRVGTAARIAYWLMPVTWFPGMYDAMSCACDGHPRPQYFALLSLGLLVGSALSVAAALARPTTLELPHVRAIATRRPKAGHPRPESGNWVHGTRWSRVELP